MELDGMKELLGMSVKERLKTGEANTGLGENIHIVEEEAKWVQKIFEWRNRGIQLSQIWERLLHPS